MKKEASPNYDFYDLLAPDEKTSIKEEAKDISINEAEPRFQLELGKFTHYQEADERKAQLVLMGFEKVFVSKQKTHYKLYMGPYLSRTLADEMQKKLEKNAIDSVVVIKKTL